MHLAGHLNGDLGSCDRGEFREAIEDYRLGPVPVAVPRAPREARARRPIGRDPGAWLITLSAFLAFALSVVLWFTDSRQEALFTDLSVPSMLALGAFHAALRRHST